MLAEVLRLLQREGTLLPAEVAARLQVPVEEADAALAVLLAAGLVGHRGPVAGCAGACGSCSISGACPAAAPFRGQRA